MFSHIMVGANDLEASKKFYDAKIINGTKNISELMKKLYFARNPILKKHI